MMRLRARAAERQQSGVPLRMLPIRWGLGRNTGPATGPAALTGLAIGLFAGAGLSSAQAPAAPPVTDAMLRDPAARGLAHVAPHPERLGLQPAGPDQPRERERPAPGVDPRPVGRLPGRHAPGLRRHPVHAEPERPPAGDRRGDRRPPVGVPAGGPGRCRGGAGRRARLGQPQRGDPRERDHRHGERRLRHMPSTRRPASWPGRRRFSTTGPRRCGIPRARSSRTARSSRGAVAGPSAGRRAA